jgi:hypothetical protein
VRQQVQAAEVRVRPYWTTSCTEPLRSLGSLRATRWSFKAIEGQIRQFTRTSRAQCNNTRISGSSFPLRHHRLVNAFEPIPTDAIKGNSDRPVNPSTRWSLVPTTALYHHMSQIIYIYITYKSHNTIYQIPCHYHLYMTIWVYISSTHITSLPYIINAYICYHHTI